MLHAVGVAKVVLQHYNMQTGCCLSLSNIANNKLALVLSCHVYHCHAQDLRKIVEDCWNPDPESRPSFEDVVNRLEAMLKALPKHSPYTKPSDQGCCVVQ